MEQPHPLAPTPVRMGWKCDVEESTIAWPRSNLRKQTQLPAGNEKLIKCTEIHAPRTGLFRSIKLVRST